MAWPGTGTTMLLVAPASTHVNTAEHAVLGIIGGKAWSDVFHHDTCKKLRPVVAAATHERGGGVAVYRQHWLG